MKKNQRGFAAVESLLILIIVGLVGFIGYYVYHTKNNTDAINDSSVSSSASNISGVVTTNWQTHTGDPTKYPLTVGSEGDEVTYSFMYPKVWNFYPIGTKNSSVGTYSFQQVGAGLNSSDATINFRSNASTLDAEAYYKQLVGDQNHLVGPVWEGVGGFTTKNAYSAYTAKLDANTGTIYETYISNKHAVIDFGYSKQHISDATLMAIFNSVKLP